MLARPSSTSTATTSGPGEEARRSPPSYGCWQPWTSPPRPRATRCRAWSGKGGWPRWGCLGARRRIYRDAPDTWDGHWHLLVIQHIPDRARRERLRAGLGYLGYAPLDDTT